MAHGFSVLFLFVYITFFFFGFRLPYLMKSLAQLIIMLPKDRQNMVLGELYGQVAESDDVIRKPSLVSWLESLNYLCSDKWTQGSASGPTIRHF